MDEHRCYHAHPDFPEKKCNALLFKGWFSGELEFRCWRCKKPAIFERSKTRLGELDKRERVAVASV